VRVLHVIPAVARRYGGPTYAVAGICKALREEDVDAEIATTDADGPRDALTLAGIQPMFGDVPVRLFHRRLGESLKYSTGLGKWLEAHIASYDVVHIHAIFSYSSVAASRVSARKRVPFLVRPLGSLDPWSMSVNTMRKKMFLRLFCSDLLHRAAQFHFTTDEEQRLASAIVQRPSFVAPLGVDEALFAAPQRPQSKEVVYVGRIHAKKNLDLLIKAFAAAAPRDSDWRLRIAGEGEDDYVRQLQAVARRAGVDQRVEFVGWVDGEQKRQLLQAASVFALPSSQENFGISTAEAMAAGVPVVVSTDVNLANDIATAGAGWVANLGTFAETLREALASEVEREKRGRAAHALALSRYRWSGTARILREVYERIQG